MGDRSGAARMTRSRAPGGVAASRQTATREVQTGYNVHMRTRAESGAAREEPAAEPSLQPDRDAAMLEEELWAREQEALADERERLADLRDTVATGRDRIADEREVIADGREALADARERLADEHDADLHGREIALNAREARMGGGAVSSRPSTGRAFDDARRSWADVERRIVHARLALERSEAGAQRGTSAVNRKAARAQREEADVERELQRGRAERPPGDGLAAAPE